MSDKPATPASSTPETDERLIALVAYLVLGFFIALALQGSRKSPHVAFHLRQALGLLVTYLPCSIVLGSIGMIPFIGWLIAAIGALCAIGFWLMGLLDAGLGKQKPLPVVGEYYQKWFATLFG